VQLSQNIGTTDELSVDIELRKRWPIRELLDSLSYFHIIENVERAILNIVSGKYLNNFVAESTLGQGGNALHEKKHPVRLDSCLNFLEYFSLRSTADGYRFYFGGKVGMRGRGKGTQRECGSC
jgi:hypothetical protein